VVIRLHTDPENRGTGAYQLLTPYTHGVPHVDCEGPSAVTRTNNGIIVGMVVLGLCFDGGWPDDGSAQEGCGGDEGDCVEPARSVVQWHVGSCRTPTPPLERLD
jgi:hypothetical protein